MSMGATYLKKNNFHFLYFSDFCISINPLISKIPIEEVEEYQNDYVETMRKYFNFYEDKNKQVINIKYNMFIIVGNKTVFSKE